MTSFLCTLSGAFNGHGQLSELTLARSCSAGPCAPDPLLVRDPEILDELHQQSAKFTASLGGVVSDDAAEQTLASRALSGNQAFIMEFERLRDRVGDLP